MYKRFADLNLGFSNAENYRKRENRSLFAKYFVRDGYLEKVLSSNVYFLVGEKGTGKTAYATYLSNNKYKQIDAKIYDVRQSEYQKFIEMKKTGQLSLSSYPDIWRVLLLMAIAETILHSSTTPKFLRGFTKLNALNNAINEFYGSAFAPELVQMMKFVESSEKAWQLIAKYNDAGGELGRQGKIELSNETSKFQINLMKLRSELEQALAALSLDDNVIVFIDGIDLRPIDVSYHDYFECVSGLVDAIWSVNNDFLSNIKDSKGRIKAVLLVRPDIILKTGLHNMNTKLRDNSVYLNWGTAYKDYRASHLFHIADRLLSSQQDSEQLSPIGKSWDFYFPFHTENVKSRTVSSKEGINSFLLFLRNGYYRPRDINTMMSLLQERVRADRPSAEYVTVDDFKNPTFRDELANYLLGEIRDQLLFYCSQEEYDAFLQFFSHLNGKNKFDYNEFLTAFDDFTQSSVGHGRLLPQFFEDADTFLQFLFEQNVVCYKETGKRKGAIADEDFIRWCFRERTLSNMAPKIRQGVTYEIFPALTKALNLGRPITAGTTASRNMTGEITTLLEDKQCGFIKTTTYKNQYYFKFSECIGFVPSIGISVTFLPVVKYSKLRARQVRSLD